MWEVGPENAIAIHLTLVPYLGKARRAQDQADPAQRQDAARDRHPAEHPLLPHRPRRSRRSIKAKIALFCNVTPDAVVTGRDVETIYEVPLALHEEGLDEKITRLLNIWTRRPDLADLGGDRPAHLPAEGRGRDRARGQVHPAQGVLQEPDRGLRARRRRQRDARRTCAGSTPRRSRRRAPSATSTASTASWSPAASASAGSRGRSPRSATRASAGCRSSGSASACSARSSSSRATSSASRARTARSSTRRRRTR